METSKTTCPICSISDHQEIPSTPLVTCTKCGLSRLREWIPEHLIREAYDKSYLWDHAQATKSWIENLATRYRHHQLEAEIRRDTQICSISEQDSILDYGAGYGDRLDYWSHRDHAPKCFGFEPYFQFPKHLEKIIYRDREMMVKKIPDASIDILEFNHVLAHIHQLVENFKRITAKVKPGGHVIIRTPNIDSYQARFFRNQWYAMDPKRMLYYFSPKTLSLFVESFGFKTIKIDHHIPWLHPATLVLSAFPALDPLAQGAHVFTKLGWGIATLLLSPIAKIESWMGHAAIITGYFQKEITS